MICHQQNFLSTHLHPFAQRPACKLSTEVGITAEAARSSEQYTSVQKAVPPHKFIVEITSGHQKKKK